MLLMVIEAYETKIHAIDAPDPVEAIKFRMEQAGLTPKDLRPMIGETNRVYEILNYTRPLTLPMIRRLNASLGIPADALIGESKLCRNKHHKSATAAKSIKSTKFSNVGKQKVTKSTKRIASKTSARKVVVAR
jgi:plasmid maintenance system antidote protein VapI